MILPHLGSNGGLLHFQVDKVVLALLQEGDKPWIIGIVDNISFSRSTFIDKSGRIQATIGGVQLRDAAGNLSSTKGTATGIIVSHWDPTPAWASEPTLHVVARHGTYSSGQQMTIQHMELKARMLSLQNREGGLAKDVDCCRSIPWASI